MTVTQHFCRSISDCTLETLPPGVVMRTKLLVLDLGGNAVRA